MVVESRIYQRSSGLINQNYSNFSSMSRESLIKVAVKEYSKQNADKLEKEIAQEYARLKDKYQDPTGQTYLFELDCWHWARYVENTVRAGHPGDIVKDGAQWDILMNHPYGMQVGYNMLLYYISAFLYKTVCLFVPVSLHAFLFYLPLLVYYYFSWHIIPYLLAFLRSPFSLSMYVVCWDRADISPA